ncbi:hypothetical protein AB0C27_53780 [Nonomuraea sp. NPDC048882]|uniref:hypothetical protein n=1 Tax=Nonomuraea sp. NPDC048882 TaxID=3154347 RepID=UPI00340C2CDD
MPRPSAHELAHAMWANRPNLLELLFLAILVMVTQWLTGLPLILLAVAVGALITGGTLRIALVSLRRHPPAESGGEAAEGGGRDAD